jgi:aminoglycoside phosphotransferase (APT) family kinase protein
MIAGDRAGTQAWALSVVMQGLKPCASPSVDALPGAASGRSTFRLSWNDDTGRTEVYAKVYARGDAWLQAGRIGRVDQALKAQDDRLRIPAVLHVEATGRCLVQLSARGRLLAELGDDSSLNAALERTGEALAKLHALPVELAGPASERDGAQPAPAHVSSVDQLTHQTIDLMRPGPHELARACPALASRIQRVQAAMHGAASQAGNAPVALLHRDAHPRQVFVGDAGVELIDWDLAGPGDPALDVANLMAHVRRRWPTRAAQTQDALLAGYGAVRGSSLLDRLPLYTAFHHLRRACKAHRLGGGIEQVRERLDAAQSVFAPGARSAWRLS